MKVSVIIPTYKREKELIETIKYILDQDYENYEVIIVDQLPKHNIETQKFLELIKSNSKVIYIKENKAGLPYARNIGIKNSSGDILIFIDDDVEVSKDFIKKYVEVFEEYKCKAIAGAELNEYHRRLENVKCETFYMWGRAKVNYFSKNFCIVRNLKGCNMAFKREIFEKIGLFDEKIPPPYIREDNDIAYRMVKNNFKILFSPKNFLYHKQVPIGGTMIYKDSKTLSRKREPWLNKNSYKCEIYFQIKHFGYSSLLFYLPVLYFHWVILKSGLNLKKFISANKAFFDGVIDGIKYYKGL